MGYNKFSMEKQPISHEGRQKRKYWAKVGLQVRDGFRMHRVSGQLEKGPDSWRNVTQHCLVQVARVGILAEWIGLSQDLIADMKMAASLHDFDKKQEIEATREAEKSGGSPLSAYKTQAQNSLILLQESGFSARVIRLANSTGGHAAQLSETKRILDKKDLSDEDLAYLICHYVDDCSVGSDWVRPNIIDFRAEENKAKPAYMKISEEIGHELERHPLFSGMNNHDAMALVSHTIEARLTDIIRLRTGESINPLDFPEMIDQRIRMAISKASKIF